MVVVLERVCLALVHFPRMWKGGMARMPGRGGSNQRGCQHLLLNRAPEAAGIVVVVVVVVGSDERRDWYCAGDTPAVAEVSKGSGWTEIPCSAVSSSPGVVVVAVARTLGTVVSCHCHCWWVRAGDVSPDPSDIRLEVTTQGRNLSGPWGPWKAHFAQA